MHVLLHIEITLNIDLDSMKYMGSLIFGSEYNNEPCHEISNNVVF